MVLDKRQTTKVHVKSPAHKIHVFLVTNVQGNIVIIPAKEWTQRILAPAPLILVNKNALDSENRH